MTLDQFIQELQGLRRAHGGLVEVTINHVMPNGSRSIDETPILYRGFMCGRLGGDVNSILIGHPEDHDGIVHWSDYMERLLLERFIAVYNPEDFDGTN